MKQFHEKLLHQYAGAEGTKKGEKGVDDYFPKTPKSYEKKWQMMSIKKSFFD